jgi:RND family efflux transporter MFP subunit
VGDEVKQGDLLAELDGESRRIVLRKRQAQLQKAEARFKKVQRDSEKAEELFKNRVISDSAYDDALLSGEMSEADLALARAEVMAAEKQLRDTKIRAPFAGRVAAREAEIGSIVAPAQTLFTFVSISKVKVALNISEFDAAKISKGSRAAVFIDSLPENVFPGAVQTIGLKADDSTRTFPVEIVISNSEGNILPGMVARVTVISQESRRVVVVPRKAVTTAGGKSVVSFLKGGKIEQKNVVTSPLFNDRVVVEKGLREGEELVVATNSL